MLQYGDGFSSEGAQLDDPLGPSLFCLASFKLARSVKSEFNVWYLDDGTACSRKNGPFRGRQVFGLHGNSKIIWTKFQ